MPGRDAALAASPAGVSSCRCSRKRRAILPRSSFSKTNELHAADWIISNELIWQRSISGGELQAGRTSRLFGKGANEPQPTISNLNCFWTRRLVGVHRNDSIGQAKRLLHRGFPSFLKKGFGQ